MAGKIVTTDNITDPAPDAEEEVLEDGTVRKSSYQAATEGTPGDPAEQPSDLGGVPMATLEERAAQLSDIDRMRNYFAARPKVSIYIPEGQDEHVIVNGYAFHLKRGEQVEVPVDVADILKTSWKGRATANKVRRFETQEF